MDNFSNFLSSLDKVEKKKPTEKKSKSLVVNRDRDRNICGPTNSAVVNQSDDHNYHRKPKLIEMFSQQNDLISETAGKQFPGLEMTRSACNIVENEMLNKEAVNVSAFIQKKMVQNENEEVSFGNKEDCGRSCGRKRRIFDDEFEPVDKKLALEDLSHNNIKKKMNKQVIFETSEEMDLFDNQPKECIIESGYTTKAETALPPLTSEVMDARGKPSSSIIKEIVQSIVAKREVISVRLTKGKSINLRCTICKTLPRKLNRSELYRHYAKAHFANKLRDEFGHLKTCPFCHLDLTSGSNASHFGQKHGFVEKFLPAEAWIPGSWLKSCQKKIPNNQIKVLDKEAELPTVEDTWVWPEIPDGFDTYGHMRGCGGAFNSAIQTHVLPSIHGFDIEVVINECCVHKEVESSEELIASTSALEQVIECRICKNMFDNKQLAVTHVQSKHVMKGSGDVLHDFRVLLRTGYLYFKCSKSSDASDPSEITLSKSVSAEEPEFSQEEGDPPSMELTREEWEIILELNDKDWAEACAVNNVDEGRESGYSSYSTYSTHSTGSGYQGSSS